MNLNEYTYVGSMQTN